MRMPTRRAAIAHSRTTWLADVRVDFAMDAFAKSLGLTWSELGAIAAAAIAAAGLLAALLWYLRRSSSGEDESADHTAQLERRQLLLSCGDVKVLADLAIQRHMSDTAFFQRFQEQPCFGVLLPHFSDEFREHLAQKPKPDRRANLATACRAECERLERLWQAR